MIRQNLLSLGLATLALSIAPLGLESAAFAPRLNVAFADDSEDPNANGAGFNPQDTTPGGWMTPPPQGWSAEPQGWGVQSQAQAAQPRDFACPSGWSCTPVNPQAQQSQEPKKKYSVFSRKARMERGGGSGGGGGDD